MSEGREHVIEISFINYISLFLDTNKRNANEGIQAMTQGNIKIC